jgi:sporulation protein YlmC with PRC-barrel domain
LDVHTPLQATVPRHRESIMPTASGHTKAIRATRVIGAKVLTRSGDEIGKVGDVILDKTADQILFAVIAREGALTAVHNFYPIPWALLDYDEDREAYVVPFTRQDFAKAPATANLMELTEADGDSCRNAAAAYFKAAS